MSQHTQLLFVYGTLTDRAQVVQLLGTGSDTNDGPTWTDCGAATLTGLHRVDGRYPTLAPGGTVTGRLLAVDAAGLERLDTYEGIEHGLYTREPLPLEGYEETVDVYLGDPDRLGIEASHGWPTGDTFDERVTALLGEHTVELEQPCGEQP